LPLLAVGLGSSPTAHKPNPNANASYQEGKSAQDHQFNNAVVVWGFERVPAKYFVENPYHRHSDETSREYDSNPYNDEWNDEGGQENGLQDSHSGSPPLRHLAEPGA
jgi:hypothetical protein